MGAARTGVSGALGAPHRPLHPIHPLLQRTHPGRHDLLRLVREAERRGVDLAQGNVEEAERRRDDDHGEADPGADRRLVGGAEAVDAALGLVLPVGVRAGGGFVPGGGAGQSTAGEGTAAQNTCHTHYALAEQFPVHSDGQRPALLVPRGPLEEAALVRCHIVAGRVALPDGARLCVWGRRWE